MAACRSKTDDVYECEKCDKKLKSVSNLKNHIKKFHKNQELHLLCTIISKFKIT